ncbi:MAG: alpha-1,2-fucosyltransferase [Ginsengibacter sp.]
MVILTAPYGQTSNRLFQHIHLDSFCRDNGIKFYNKFLWNLYQDYPNLKAQSDNKLVNYFLKGITKLPLRTVSFDNYQQHEYYKSLILKSKILFCDGWVFSHETTLKYRSIYQELFNPAIEKSNLETLWLNKTNDNEKIVGVHIRRGDYKTYADGIYFFEDDVYIDKMKQMELSLNQNCKFIIFSNDDQLDFSKYTKLFKNILISNNSVVTDHYLMSKCDYIIGPPSTFSIWASYIGETLLYHFLNKEDIITLDRFTIHCG